LYQADYIILDDLEEIKESMPELKKILKTSNEITPLLKFYSRALSLAMQLCTEIEDVWKKISFQLVSALKDIENYFTIKYEEPVKVAKNVKLPNAWYITSYGDLYNTGGKRGHKETNLVYPYESITRSFLENQSIVGISDGLLRKRLKIISNGYIDKFDFVDYLNYAYDMPSIQTSDDYHYLDKKSYELRIVKIILGVVSAEAGLYHFFENIQEYTYNPKGELDKLRYMVRNDMRDILVRCSGFYKIESAINKTITTSSLKPFEDLYEYIIRGWNVCTIPPIIVNREKGIVEELDTTSPIVEKYIDSDIKKYEKNKVRYLSSFFSNQRVCEFTLNMQQLVDNVIKNNGLLNRTMSGEEYERILTLLNKAGIKNDRNEPYEYLKSLLKNFGYSPVLNLRIYQSGALRHLMSLRPADIYKS
jgi:hypothetical protein